MIKKEQIKKGDKVYYQPDYLKNSNGFENGIVKEVTEFGVRVVYHCGNDWGNYEKYTAPLTDFEDLNLGWEKKRIKK